jgi:hypothetical protein
LNAAPVVGSERVELGWISKGDCLGFAVHLLDGVNSEFTEVVNDLTYEDLWCRGSSCDSDGALSLHPFSLDLVLVINEVAGDAFALAELS